MQNYYLYVNLKIICLKNTHMNYLLLWISFLYDTSHVHYKKNADYTLSAEILLPVCKSVHKNTGKLACDHCQITDPDPAHISSHTGFSSDYINSFSVGQVSRPQITVGGLLLNFIGVGKPKKMTKSHSYLWLQWTRNDALNKRKTSCAHTVICQQHSLGTEWGMTKSNRKWFFSIN